MEHLAEKISDSDLEIMQVLWEAEDALPMTEIRVRVQQRVDWKDTTVKTLVQRLCDKGVLKSERPSFIFPESAERNTRTGPPAIWCASSTRAAQRILWRRWSIPRVSALRIWTS